MAEIDVVSKTQTSITVQVIELGEKYNQPTFRTVSWQIDGKYKANGITIPNQTSVSPEFTFTGLSPGTSYDIGAYLTWSGGSTSIFKYGVTTEKASFDGELETDSTTNSISVRLTSINKNYPRDHNMRFTFNLAYNEVISFNFNVESTRTSWYPKSGLKPNTQYYVEVVVKDLDTGWSDKWTKWVWTQRLSVEKWDWSTSNGTATAAQTKAALKALTSKGPTTDFSYLVWNDMCTKVQAIQNAAGKSWSTKYATFNNTKMTSSDRRITATRFNSLRYNIGINESTGINEVDQGDTVMAWYFTTLANTMNTWIDKL